MLDFISNLTLFGIIGYTVMLLIIATTIGHWLEYLSMKGDEMSPISSDEKKSWKQQLRDTDIKDWRRIPLNIAAEKQPIAIALLRLLAAPRRFGDARQYERVLALEIDQIFSPLESAAERVKSSAPAWGLFFTIVGVILACAEFAESASVAGMLASVGPALGTTALGAIASIIEKNLIHSHLIPLQSQMKRDGNRLLMDVADIYARKLQSAPQKAVAKPHPLQRTINHCEASTTERAKRWQ